MANSSERIGGPVIGAQYCVPSTCKYKLFRTDTGSENWSVVDEANGTVIFTLGECQANYFRRTNSGSRWIPGCDTQLVDAQGNIVARIQDMQRTEGQRIERNGWDVLGGPANSNLLCTARVCEGWLFWKSAIKVLLASNLSKKQPDYMVELSRNFWDSDCIILHGTERLSEVKVNRKWYDSRREYTVTVNAGANSALVLLLVMIMEKHLEQEIIQPPAASNDGGGFHGPDPFHNRDPFPHHDFPRHDFPDHNFHHRHDHDFHPRYEPHCPQTSGSTHDYSRHEISRPFG